MPLDALAPPERERLRALNNAHAVETSHLEPAEWERLIAEARLALGTRDGAGFLFALAPGARYESANYRWFSNKFERFLYVDRVVVAAHARGRGLARALYAVAAETARSDGLDRLVCEVNRCPPNPGSDAFHAALGFRALATVDLGPHKSVRYLELAL